MYDFVLEATAIIKINFAMQNFFIYETEWAKCIQFTCFLFAQFLRN